MLFRSGTEFCREALEMAFEGGRRPEIFHSVQGCQLTSADFVARLETGVPRLRRGPMRVLRIRLYQDCSDTDCAKRTGGLILSNTMFLCKNFWFTCLLACHRFFLYKLKPPLLGDSFQSHHFRSRKKLKLSPSALILPWSSTKMSLAIPKNVETLDLIILRS